MLSYNKSRLAYYASSGDEEAVKYCLSHGRDPNAPDSEGIYSIAVPPISRDFLGRTPPTPLLQAIISKQLGCAALLLEAGADPHLSSEDVQYTPMHIYPVREDGYHYLFAYYMDETKFSQTDYIQDAVIRQLAIVGEAARNVPPDIQAKQPDIPWRKIADFRNVIIHEYSGVSLGRVWRIIIDDVPILEDQLIALRKAISA